MRHIFVADRIYTMDTLNDWYRAMIVENGKIVKLLNEEEVHSEINEFTNINFLQGYIFPGFIDSHIHAISYGKYMEYLDLRSVESIKDMVEKVTEKAKNSRPEEWIIGIGWNQEKFRENRYPTKNDLDSIPTSNPIVLNRVCTHIMVCNSIVLEKAGVTNQTPNPVGGVIDKDDNGNPTGILRETAIDVVKDLMPKPMLKDQARWLKTAQTKLNSYGITSIHTLDEDCYPIYKKLKDQLTLRVYFCPKDTELNKLYQVEPSACTGLGDDMFRLGRLKLFADGSLGAQTAALRDPYENSDNFGVPIHPDEELKRMIIDFNRRGWQIETHAIGDRAAELVLECYETIYKHNYRPVLNHCQILGKDLIQCMTKLEVIASIQPIFIEQDMDFVEKFIGKSRMEYAYAWKTLLDNGIHCSGGSDAPVDSPNPLYGIYAAVTRQKIAGFPENGWIPQQKLSVWEALRLFTTGAAYAEYQDHQKGILKPGYLADFILLDKDLFHISSNNFLFVNVLKTFVGGKEVFSRDALREGSYQT